MQLIHQIQKARNSVLKTNKNIFLKVYWEIIPVECVWAGHSNAWGSCFEKKKKLDQIHLKCTVPDQDTMTSYREKNKHIINFTVLYGTVHCTVHCTELVF